MLTAVALLYIESIETRMNNLSRKSYGQNANISRELIYNILLLAVELAEELLRNGEIYLGAFGSHLDGEAEDFVRAAEKATLAKLMLQKAGISPKMKEMDGDCSAR
jgi:hypothetical protein